MAARDLRETLMGFLRTVASKEKQLQYQRNVPFIDVPGELICQWFDDLYHPDAKLFHEAFSESERSMLADFDRFFEARKEGLPASIAELHASPVWDAICRRAQNVIEEIEGHTASG